MSIKWYVWNEDGTIEGMPIEEYISRPSLERGIKIVKQEYVGDVWVSTVFLNMDHGDGGGQPLLFETMVFKCDVGNTADLGDECEQRRYTNHRDALDGHEYFVEKYRC